MRQLLKYLCEIEQNYAERVRACKQKDAIRAAEIIPDYLLATNINSMSLEGEWAYVCVYLCIFVGGDPSQCFCCFFIVVILTFYC